MRSALTEQRGQVVLAGVYWLVILVSVVVGTGMTRTLMEVQAAKQLVAKAQAFQAAEGGVDAAIIQNRNAGWAFRTHQADGVTPITPSPTLPITTLGSIDVSNNYLVSTGAQTPAASVKIWSSAADPSLVQIRSSGALGSSGPQVVTADVLPGGLLDYVLLVDGDYTLDVGQKLTVLGHQGRIHIEKNFQLESGNATVATSKEWEVEAGRLNVYGAIIRTTDASDLSKEAPINIRQTGTTDWKTFPTPPNGPGFISNIGGVTQPAYLTWITASPVDLLASGFLKEKSTGALPLASFLTSVPTIDDFLSSFQSQAAINMTSAADLNISCAGAATPKTFANASTLQLVTVVEVDVQRLNTCSWLNSPKVLYSQVPLRLVNGQKLNAPLTVASPKAIYIEGNFNTDTPQPAAMVTGNRTYHLSSVFKDYSGFITPAPLTTLADTITGYSVSAASDYTSFKATYGDPAGAGVILPPTSSWLGTYAAPTTQYAAIVSPANDSDVEDRNWYTKYGLLEDWSKVGTSTVYVPPPKDSAGDPPFQLKRVGAFINLKFAAGSPLIAAQDRRAKKSDGTQLKRNHVYNEPEHVIEYDANFSTKMPPGFGGSGKGRQVYWAHKAP